MFLSWIIRPRLFPTTTVLKSRNRRLQSVVIQVNYVIRQRRELTSLKVGVRLVGAQEHGLAWIQDHVVEEVDGEAADVSGVLRVEAEQQVPVAAGCVLPGGTCARVISIKDCVRTDGGASSPFPWLPGSSD